MVDSESVVGIKPGDCGVMIGDQVDEFTDSWSAEQFVAFFHIYSWFTGEVSSLTHFPLKPGCENYSFLDQAVAHIDYGLDSILTDSIKTPELDTSLDEPDAIKSSVSSGLLHLVSNISDTFNSASKFICYFSSHPAVFGFWSSTSPNNITLTPVNMNADQSLSEFQTGICTAAHATLDTEQLISCLRFAVVDTITSLSNSEGGVIPLSKVCELLIKVHDILDNAVSNELGTHLIFYHMCLILLPGSIMRSGLHSSPFFMVSKMWFLIVRLAYMAV